MRDARGALWLAAGSAATLLAAACGGKAVVDGEAALGGAGGATTTTGTGATTTTWTTSPTTTTSITTLTTTTGGAGAGGAPPSCDEMLAELEQTVAEAMACNPWVNAIQCTAAGVVFDACGCALAGNETNLPAVMAARDAYDQWVGWGCGPWDCTFCPPSPESSPWFCHPDLGRCEAAYEG